MDDSIGATVDMASHDNKTHSGPGHQQDADKPGYHRPVLKLLKVAVVTTLAVGYVMGLYALIH